jgi:hypothetical protein
MARSAPGFNYDHYPGAFQAPFQAPSNGSYKFGDCICNDVKYLQIKCSTFDDMNIHDLAKYIRRIMATHKLKQFIVDVYLDDELIIMLSRYFPQHVLFLCEDGIVFNMSARL